MCLPSFTRMQLGTPPRGGRKMAAMVLIHLNQLLLQAEILMNYERPRAARSPLGSQKEEKRLANLWFVLFESKLLKIDQNVTKV